MANTNLIGTWEVTGSGSQKNYFCVHGSCCDHGLGGVRFRLDENGDVTWMVPESLKSVPLFSCETYEIYNTTVLTGILRFGAYAGHVLEFRVEQNKATDCIVLTCEAWTKLHCKRVPEETNDNDFCIPFSLLSALENGYFYDLTLTSANNKQFKVHTTILELLAPDIDWRSEPPPFAGLPEDVLGTILHYLYAECLPETLTEATAKQVIAAATPHESLGNLVKISKLYLKNMALKQQIIDLVNDMHSCMNRIIEHFNTRQNVSSSDITSNPEKLCNIVKQSIRDAAVANIKVFLLCDLFTKRKNELTREERHEIIRYAKSRIPIFLTQSQRILECLKNTFNVMPAAQRLEVATYLVPEIEVILDTISTLIVQVEKALQQIIQVFSPYDNAKPKQGVGDMLGKSLRNLLHIKELSKLRNFHEHITYSLGLLIHKKEHFNGMTHSQKVRSIARNLEKLIEELPIFLLRLEEVTTALDDKLEWREFKFCFKVGTSKISGILKKLVAHKDTLRDVMLQLCELVQREDFTQSLYSLGLVDANASASTVAGQSSSDCQANRGMTRSHSSHYGISKQHHGYKLNLVESLCVPPSTSCSSLSRAALRLFVAATEKGDDKRVQKSSVDMEFEVVEDGADGEERCTTIGAHRVIVAARCDWFRRALNSGMREAIDRKIVIHDTSPALFTRFLEYLYSGKLRQTSLSLEQLEELLLLSDIYEVDTLKQTCEYCLQAGIDHHSALYFLRLADQYNARTLKAACLDYISQHHDLTESELFYELPIALQAEIFDCVWTMPTTRKSMTMEQLLPTSSASPNTDSGAAAEPLNKGIERLHVDGERREQHQRLSCSSSMEDLPLAQDRDRLEECIWELRAIVGEQASREHLTQVILAADYDLTRAIHYFFNEHDRCEP